MSFRSHFRFNKQERSGIFFLLLLIVLLQMAYFLFKTFPAGGDSRSYTVDSVQQAQIDLLKLQASQKDTVKVYPFNPNFISDYKGYVLGMTTEEIDRLHVFRATDSYVNSALGFQEVTGVSDSLLQSMQPYFKFPDWKKKPSSTVASYPEKEYRKEVGETVADLNSATAEELKTISGIGDKLSARIVKFRNRLGGFLVDDQLFDVYGLEPDVVKRALSKFKVINVPEIEKISVTWASYNELRNLLYISDKFAKSIIEHRNNNAINSLSELKQLEGFPEGRFERLKLYLSL